VKAVLPALPVLGKLAVSEPHPLTKSVLVGLLVDLHAAPEFCGYLKQLVPTLAASGDAGTACDLFRRWGAFEDPEILEQVASAVNQETTPFAFPLVDLLLERGVRLSEPVTRRFLETLVGQYSRINPAALTAAQWTWTGATSCLVAPIVPWTDADGLRALMEAATDVPYDLALAVFAHYNRILTMMTVELFRSLAIFNRRLGVTEPGVRIVFIHAMTLVTREHDAETTTIIIQLTSESMLACSMLLETRRMDPAIALGDVTALAQVLLSHESYYSLLVGVLNVFLVAPGLGPPQFEILSAMAQKTQECFRAVAVFVSKCPVNRVTADLVAKMKGVGAALRARADELADLKVRNTLLTILLAIKH
jgi:hypothetical protein